jgi:hypothetical protein
MKTTTRKNGGLIVSEEKRRLGGEIGRRVAAKNVAK